MFLEPQELKTAMYTHVIDTITGGDEQIVVQCIQAAVDELSSYLAQRYNTSKIFAATGDDRNRLILEHTKAIAVWNIIRLSSAETLYDAWQERYDRIINWCRAVAKGTITPELPLLISEQGEVDVKMKFSSNPKFTHHF